MSIMCLILLVLFFTQPTKNSSNLFQKLISLLWIYFGYRKYVDGVLFGIDTLETLLGISSFFIGIMLFMNYIKFYQAFKNSDGFSSKLGCLFSFIFLFSNYGIYDLESNRFLSYDKSSYGQSLNFVFLALNLIPLINNSFFHSKITGLDFKLFPNYISLGCMTLFFLNYKHSLYSGKIYLIVEMICCFLLIVKFINDINNRNFTPQLIFFIILLCINVAFLYLFPYSFTSLTEEKTTTIVSFQKFIIRESLLADAGIEGFYGIDLFIDEYQTIANEFIEITSDNKILSLSDKDKLTSFNKVNKLEKQNFNSKLARKVFPKMNIN